MGEIRNPHAYNRAIDARIKANASKTRRAKFEADIANDSPEFKFWLTRVAPPGLFPKREAWSARFDELFRKDDDGAATPEEREELHQMYNDEYASHVEMNAFDKLYGMRPSFLGEAILEWGGLSVGQLAFARKCWAERLEKGNKRAAEQAERKANAPHWVAGRVKNVTGKVVSARVEEFGINRWHSASSIKGMIALPDGRMLWTTIPNAVFQYEAPFPDGSTGTHYLNIDEIKGRTITIGAVTVSPADNDPTMAFGKRPTGGTPHPKEPDATK